MACRFPGARDPDALWSLLSAGSSAIGRPPAHRRGLGDGTGDGTGNRTGDHLAGYLDDIDQLDSLLFGISPAEAKTLDPQLRLVLETIWECLEDAGHSAASLQRSAGKVSVIVGAMWQDYQQVGAEHAARDGAAQVSAAGSDIAHRVSQCFDFHGPSLAVDAACTSSLAAIHLAAESLRRGECGAVIVAAVNLFAHPYHLELLAGLGLSASRAYGAFSADASGWIPGEGVAAILLRPMAAALESGEVLHGIIEAAGMSHAGRQLGTDPAGLARSLQDLLARHRLSPRQISYVECAAAGAAVGDAAELEALAEVFADADRAGAARAPSSPATGRPRPPGVQAGP